MAPIKAKLLFSNLLSNAIKYSHPQGEIRIELTQEAFVIEDQGIGIAKEKLGEIFRRYKRANEYAGGFGVGMNIVKNIADTYHFEIEIDSQVGKGTIVTIRW
jgi:two-component system OmpR family sensor kinase